MNSIVLRVDNNTTYIDGRLQSAIYQSFRKELGYLPENSFWMIRNYKEGSNKDAPSWKSKWDGYVSTVCWNEKTCRCNIKKKGTHFPTGLLSKALSFFDAVGVTYVIQDIRNTFCKSTNYSMSDDFEYRDYQIDVINKIVGNSGYKGIDRGIIKLCTGSGKTAVSSGIIAGIGLSPTIFYVPSIELLYQAKNEIERFVRYLGKNVEVGVIGGGKKDIKDINVMTIQTAVRSLGGVWVKYDEEDYTKDESNIDNKEEIRDLIRSAKLIICDEVQHWAAETCQIISDNSINAQYRIGASATPYRDSGDDILIDACFGRVIADINASFLIKRNYLVKPTIYFSSTSRLTGLSKSSYPALYKKAIVENGGRNKIILNLANEFKNRDRKVLILVKQIVHGNLLEKIIPDSVFLHGSTSKKKRLKHLDVMREGKPSITIASVIFDEGIDVRPLDTLILAGSGKSSTRALQRIGRILRPYGGKEDAIAVDFMDQCKYLKQHSLKRLSIYKTEEEFEIIGQKS